MITVRKMKLNKNSDTKVSLNLLNKMICVECCKKRRQKNNNYKLYNNAQCYFVDNLEISRFLKEFNRHKAFLKYFFSSEQYNYFIDIINPLLFLNNCHLKKERKNLTHEDFIKLGLKGELN